MTIETGFDPLLGAFYYRCLFGCYETGFKSTLEAERALAAHDCGFRQVPEES